MKTATVRQLRHKFGSVLNWVEEGEEVEIRKRGKLVALISPPPPLKIPQRKKRKNFLGRLKRIYGEKQFHENIVVQERQSRPY